MIRQILGSVRQFEKAMLVAKLKGARDRKKAEIGKCGRPSLPSPDHRRKPRCCRGPKPSRIVFVSGISLGHLLCGSEHADLMLLLVRRALRSCDLVPTRSKRTVINCRQLASPRAKALDLVCHIYDSHIEMRPVADEVLNNPDHAGR
jgi:hypothetical protein